MTAQVISLHIITVQPNNCNRINSHEIESEKNINESMYGG